MTSTIQFGGLTLGDAPWKVTHLAGWWDAPPSRSVVNPRPQADGAFGVSHIWRDARVITVEGYWRGTDKAEARAAQRQLAALQGAGSPSVFSVTDDTGTLSCVAGLAAAPILSDQLRGAYFDFKFDLVAYDPVLYGDPVVVVTGPPVSGGGLVWPLGSSEE